MNLTAGAIDFILAVKYPKDTPLNRASRDYDRLTTAMKTTAKEAFRSGQTVGGTMDKTTKAVKSAEQSMSKMDKTTGSWSKTAKDSMADLKKSVKGATGSMSKDIALLSKSRGGNAAQLLPFTTKLLNRLPMLAEGGIATKPTQAIVGEAGAEAIIPLKKLSAYLKGQGENLGEKELSLKLDYSDMKGVTALLKTLIPEKQAVDLQIDTASSEEIISLIKGGAVPAFKDLGLAVDRVNTEVGARLRVSMHGLAEDIAGVSEEMLGAAQDTVTWKESINDLKQNWSQFADDVAVFASIGFAASLESASKPLLQQTHMVGDAREGYEDLIKTLSMDLRTPFDEISGSMATFIDYGYKDAKALEAITRESKILAETTGMATEAAGDMLYKMEDLYGLDPKKYREFGNSMKYISDETAASSEDLSGYMDNWATLLSKTPKAIQTEMIPALLAVSGATKNVWGDTNTLSEAMTNMASTFSAEGQTLRGYVGQTLGIGGGEVKKLLTSGAEGVSTVYGGLVDTIKNQFDPKTGKIQNDHFWKEVFQMDHAQLRAIAESNSADAKVLVEGAMEAFKNTERIDAAWKAMGEELGEVIKLVKQTGIAFMATFGKPLLGIIKTVLEPFMGALRGMMDIYEMLPGGLQTTVSLVVTLFVAFKTLTSSTILVTKAMLFFQSSMFLTFAPIIAFALALGLLWTGIKEGKPAFILLSGVLMLVGTAFIFASAGATGFLAAIWPVTLAIGLIVVAVGLLWLAFKYGGKLVSWLWKKFMGIEFVQKAVTRLGLVFKVVWGFIKTVFQGLKNFFGVTEKGAKGFGSTMLHILTYPYVMLWKGIKKLWGYLAGFFSWYIGILKGSFDFMKQIFSDPFGMLTKALNGVYALMEKVFGVEFMASLVEGIKTVFGKVSGFLLAPFRAAKEGIMSLISSIPNFLLPKSMENMKSSTTGVTAMGAGGIVMNPMLAQIGEKGKEAVIPLTGTMEWIKNSPFMKTLVDTFNPSKEDSDGVAKTKQGGKQAILAENPDVVSAIQHLETVLLRALTPSGGGGRTQQTREGGLLNMISEMMI